MDASGHPRHPIRHAIAFGLLAGALGAWWIVQNHTRTGYALGYHVPLAVVFTAALVDATFEALHTRRFGFHWAAGLAGALIAGRMIEDWPLSGHGILGFLLAASPIRAPFRVAGVLIAIQAAVTKAVLGEYWLAVVWGAACGVALAMIGRWVDRLKCPAAAAVSAPAPEEHAAAGTGGSRRRT